MFVNLFISHGKMAGVAAVISVQRPKKKIQKKTDLNDQKIREKIIVKLSETH